MLGLDDKVGDKEGTSNPSTDGAFDAFLVGLDDTLGSDDGVVDPKTVGESLGILDGELE